MRKELQIAIRFTLITTLLFGLVYPLIVTGLSQLLFPHQANGSLVQRDGKVIGSELIGQTFSSDGYFHSRPSSAGDGYDAANSSGSNLAPTNHALIERVQGDVARLHAENPAAAIPVDLVTASGSGLDPHISPAAADFQVPRVARTRNISQDALRALVAKHTESRQFGIFGESRVNVLALNLELDSAFPGKK
ncbi:MAG TPA: potassium-transporting ATPase subunit KdpC [Candidatus Acidoferrum sp.]|nr:potassium-transporting ATPase subunit KdpC [Candidatus Acidoferrum sp.]